jgi:hypothetical protein
VDPNPNPKKICGSESEFDKNEFGSTTLLLKTNDKNYKIFPTMLLLLNISRIIFRRPDELVDISIHNKPRLPVFSHGEQVLPLFLLDLDLW